MPIDYSRYPKNWKKEIVPAILERAGNACEFCGLPNHSTVYSVPFETKDNGKYKQRSIWFRVKQDAVREAGGAEERDFIREVKVVLTISHLDHDEENHDVSFDRLRALCQACHCRYDAKEKYQRQIKKWDNQKK